MSNALVLSGGGPVGIAWESGLTASLVAAGVDLHAADLIVGTSAGAVVGAEIALGRDPANHAERMLAQRDEERERSDKIAPRLASLMQVIASVGEATPEERLKHFSHAVLTTQTDPEEEFLALFDHLEDAAWPDNYCCTAIDATEARFVTWTASSGVDLVRAIASSCAVPCVFPAITIDGRPYFDGGMRSLTNADIAVGRDRVVVVSTFFPGPEMTDPRAVRYRRMFEEEWEAIRSAGGAHQFIAPDDEAREAIGLNFFDPGRVGDAFEAGVAQGERAAPDVLDFWTT